MNYKEIVEDLVNNGADNIKKKTVEKHRLLKGT